MEKMDSFMYDLSFDDLKKTVRNLSMSTLFMLEGRIIQYDPKFFRTVLKGLADKFNNKEYQKYEPKFRKPAYSI